LQKHLHIISFDIPYPANYGGVIDVFHKIRCLHQKGMLITLHCFEYGDRKPAPELEKYCNKVYYYKRQTSLLNQFSTLPYNVISRIDGELKERLMEDEYPILFEVLHTCYLLGDPDLKNRKTFFRHSNIEHEYFRELAKAESSFVKKMYLNMEARKLQRFEKRITHADCILAVSEQDLSYFKKTYPQTPSVYLPSFHPFDALQNKTGKGDYILYHGNLSVPENHVAALWLIDHVFSKLSQRVVIAGLNPQPALVAKIKSHPHIELKENCSGEEMQALITDAQIHCLYTAQATGLKLKLLNVLYSGRFVLANPAMLAGTQLHEACVICDSGEAYLKAIQQMFESEFTQADIEKRRSIIAVMNNEDKTNLLIELIN
jgi:hypothetical protein